MLEQLKNWLANRRYMKGYNYAAGSLLIGSHTTLELQMEKNRIDYNEYHEGVDDAIKSWEKLPERFTA